MKLCVLIFLVIFSVYNNSLAYQIAEGPQGDTFSNTFKSDLEKDGSMATVELIKTSTGDADLDISLANVVIQIESKGKKFTKDIKDISRDSSEVLELVISDNINPFIVLSSYLPPSAHAWGVTIYSFNGKEIVEELDVISDEPSVQVEDVDNDGTKEVIVWQRDYDNAPIIDKYLETYKYINNKWHLVSVYRTKPATN